MPRLRIAETSAASCPSSTKRQSGQQPRHRGDQAVVQPRGEAAVEACNRTVGRLGRPRGRRRETGEIDAVRQQMRLRRREARCQHRAAGEDDIGALRHFLLHAARRGTIDAGQGTEIVAAIVDHRPLAERPECRRGRRQRRPHDRPLQAGFLRGPPHLGANEAGVDRAADGSFCHRQGQRLHAGKRCRFGGRLRGAGNGRAQLAEATPEIPQPQARAQPDRIDPHHPPIGGEVPDKVLGRGGQSAPVLAEDDHVRCGCGLVWQGGIVACVMVSSGSATGMPPKIVLRSRRSPAFGCLEKREGRCVLANCDAGCEVERRSDRGRLRWRHGWTTHSPSSPGLSP